MAGRRPPVVVARAPADAIPVTAHHRRKTVTLGAAAAAGLLLLTGSTRKRPLAAETEGA